MDHAEFRSGTSVSQVGSTRRRGLAAVLTLAATLTLAVEAAPQAEAAPSEQFPAGAGTLGDPLFPGIGNGGYDVRAYAVRLRYSPKANRLRRGTRTTIRAVATQNLGRLSLDFQRLAVASVTIDGASASFSQRRAEPQLQRPATRLHKLIVDPPAGIVAGSKFEIEVVYRGRPQPLTDPDGNRDGWIPTSDGAYVGNEPNGAQGWFPANNHPSDKARIRTIVDVPRGHVALGVGQLDSVRRGGNRRLWSWRERKPTATYATTATVGRFKLRQLQARLGGADPRESIDSYEAIDSAASRRQRRSVSAALAKNPGMLRFLARRFGPYPFDSTGVVVDRVAGVPYALEVQTKPHFPDLHVNRAILLHEQAHQWFGDAVSPADWSVVWHNEGWAQWAQWQWEHDRADGNSPAKIFTETYEGTDAEKWSVPPATLNGDPSLLFSGFPVYVRSAMTLEGYRQIVGNDRFFELARELQRRYGYDSLTTEQFIELAKQNSGFTAADLARLDDYLRQWLYGSFRPTILPEAF